MQRTLLLIIAVSMTMVTVVQAQVPVRVAPLQEVLVDLERRAPAAVLPLNDAQIAAEVAAVVGRVYAEVGQQVSAGDLLLELDNTDYQLNLEQARANLASAQAQKNQADLKVERARQLTDSDYLSADELLDRETDVHVRLAQIQAAEVAVRIAQRNLEKCAILAPFDGVVTQRQAQIGSFVDNGSPLFRLVQIDEFELDAELPVNVADSLLHADNTWFESRNERWELRLLRLSPVIEAERRSQRARFAFVGDSPKVGRSGELVWQVARGLLPANLVSRRDGRLGVFIAENDTAVFRPLPGAQEGRPVEVELPPATEVITMGHDRLQNGTPLSVSR